jgi:hypothetical protein
MKHKHKVHWRAKHTTPRLISHAHKQTKEIKPHKLTGAEREKMLKEQLEKNPKKCYQIILASKHLPFSVKGGDFKKVEESELKLQDFVKLIEKKFDAVWYIGPDFLGNEMFERFMFHHGGLMEISLNGKVRCFFVENKCDKMENALIYAVKKMGSENMAKMMDRDIKIGQRLISLNDSLMKERGRAK